MCHNPIVVKISAGVNKGKYIQVPCGKCTECLQRKQSDWYVRLYEHYKCYSSSLFLTLTYNDDSLPCYVYDDYSSQYVMTRGLISDSFPSLFSNDVSLFIKRLRRSIEYYYEKLQMSYFACGEYGSLSHRPHYHLILFGLDSSFNDIIKSKWKYGFIYSENIRSPASLRYVSKYVTKSDVFAYQNNGIVQKPKILCSNFIGASYVNDSTFSYHHSNLLEHDYYCLPNGVKVPLPSYYKDKLFSSLDKYSIQCRYEDKMFSAFRELFCQPVSCVFNGIPFNYFENRYDVSDADILAYYQKLRSNDDLKFVKSYYFNSLFLKHQKLK